MAIVTVKPKFQVTIPAKLRRDIDLQEGDILEASLIGNGILFKPKDVIDRVSTANRIAEKFASTQLSSENSGRSEDDIMESTIGDIAQSRCETRSRIT